jgi:hypothetical protein
MCRRTRRREVRVAAVEAVQSVVVRRVRVSERMRMAVRAWRARWTGAEEGRMTHRNYHGDFRRYFTENASEFGVFVANGAIDGELRAALQAFGAGTSKEPALLLRRAFPRRLLPVGFSARFSRSPGRAKTALAKPEPHHPRAYIRKGRFDIVAAALIAAAGAELRQKNKTDLKVWQDFITDADSEITRFRECRDLWQRFRQATPEFAPDDVRPENVAASIVLIACVENTIDDPVYVLSAADVLKGLDQETLSELRKKQFEFVDGWASDLSEVNRNLKRIVGGDADSAEAWWLSFDPNRIICQSDKTSPEGRKAVGRLMQEIERASARAAPIVLRRGDALLVNNYRALVRRKERARFVITWPWPAIRWLRVYYGFPMEKGGAHGKIAPPQH